MQASQEIRRGVQPAVLVAVLLSTMLLSGAAGFLVRGGLPQLQAPAAVTDTVPSWAHQGMGPTDADADQAAPRQCEGYACTLEGERELAERAPATNAQQAPVTTANECYSYGAGMAGITC